MLKNKVFSAILYKVLKIETRYVTKLVKDVTDTPCAIGFGISTPEQAKEMAAHADGVIVGSAIVKLCAKLG